MIFNAYPAEEAERFNIHSARIGAMPGLDARPFIAIDGAGFAWMMRNGKGSTYRLRRFKTEQGAADAIAQERARQMKEAAW